MILHCSYICFTLSFSFGVAEASGPSISSEIENVDADNHGVLDSKQFDMMKLGESCVLVEKSEHSFKLPLSDEQKSYKVPIWQPLTIVTIPPFCLREREREREKAPMIPCFVHIPTFCFSFSTEED